jgi:hypothetical protein
MKSGVVHCIYTPLIRPVLTYGSMIWWLKTSKTAQEIKEISLSGHNRGDEDDPNSCIGVAFRTSSLMHLVLSS